MRVQRNYDDYEENTGGGIMPDGKYMFEIAEKEDSNSKAGDVMINITLRCVEEAYSGNFVWDRILLPLPNSPAHKVIGRSKRFLHCIGEPYQGNFDVDTDRWVGKLVEAEIGHEVYDSKSKNIVKRYILQEDTNQPSSNQNPSTTNNNAAYSNYSNKDDDLPF